MKFGYTMRTILLAAMFFMFLGMMPSFADTFLLYGYGDYPCREFLSTYGAATLMDGKVKTDAVGFDLNGYMNWLYGFVSGHNWQQDLDDNISLPDTDTLLPWLKRFCESNPTDHFYSAAESLIAELAKAGRSASK